MARAMPDATFRLVEGSGHMLPVEAPEATTAMLVEWASL
jgi:pimeloyl-ACP methyl ester carboxylesterase